jgi:O-antigen/teichoic acid export membrane protein
MPNQITGKSVAKNISLSVLVQAISLIVSFVLNLIVPKFIDEYQYSYWQTFLLYAQYVGILHFGLLDGIVLRYSQYDYDELDKKVVDHSILR